MKPKYLDTSHFRKYKEYCSIKCINIVFEQQGIEEGQKRELRGRYKGYLYGMKLFNSLQKRKQSVANYEIYNHLKFYVSWKSNKTGEDKAIYDLMNMLCDESPNRGIEL